MDVVTGPLLEATALRRAFGTVQAVVDATLAVPPGHVTALIGPNGCGKTTLMLMLAGLLRPDGGEVTVAGLDPVAEGAAARRHLGWMPDVLGTWDSLTCEETLTTFGRAYGLGSEAARQRSFELLRTVHLAEYAAQPARVLSRGQKQRLSLARALVHDPAVLILDEPASGLDPRSRIELRELVRSLAADGKAVLISSHVLSELDEMVDSAVFMSKGSTLGADADALVARARLRWMVTARPGTDLRAVLDSLGREWEAAGEDQSRAAVQVVDADDAADLLAALATAGARLSAFGPAGSALEQAYLTMEEDRR
nr:ABC transporter ATP-binding protein [Demequina sp.]